MWWRHVLRRLLPISRIIRRDFGPCCAARTAKSLANLVCMASLKLSSVQIRKCCEHGLVPIVTQPGIVRMELPARPPTGFQLEQPSIYLITASVQIPTVVPVRRVEMPPSKRVKP